MNKTSTAKFKKAASGWVERQRHSLFKKIIKHSLEDPLEKGMATHSSFLAWRIPWTEEPVGLQSLGWQRVGQDWATNSFSGSNPELEGVTKLQNGCFPEEQEIWTPGQAPQPLDSTRERQVFKILGFENWWGVCPKKIKLYLHETELRLILLHAWTTVVNSLIWFKRLCDDLGGWDGGVGRRLEGVVICILIADSYCCTGESNTL